MSSTPGTPKSAVGLGRASALLASGTLVSRILGFIKAIVITATIGQTGSAAADAFGVANQLPNNVYALVAGGVLSAVLVPQIVRAGLHDDGGQIFINRLLTLGLVVFIAVAALATIAAPLLVSLYAQQSHDGGRGFSPDAFALAIAFAYWCLPQVLFYAVYSLLGEVLNARESFGPFTWAPVLNNVVAIAGLVAFMMLFGGASQNSSAGVWTGDKIALLAGSTTLGVAAQAGILGFFWRRIGLRYRPEFRWRGVGLGRAGKAAGWTFFMILSTQLAGIVQTNVASLASSHGASVFTVQNSFLVFMLPHSIVAVSIATPYFTRMAGHASRGNLSAVKADLSSSLRSIGLIIVFASVALIVVSYPFSRFFESKFGNIQAMANVIMAYLLGLAAFSALFVLQRAFYALEDTRTPFFTQCFQSSLFVIGALFCTRLPVEWIGVGIAVVTTVAGTAQTVLAFLLLRRRLGQLDGRRLLARHLQYLAAALVSGVAGYALLLALGGTRAGGFALADRMSALISVAAIGAGMAVVYLGMLVLMRSPELSAMAKAVFAKLGGTH